MDVDTCPLGFPPDFGHTLVDVGLVYYLGYVLRHVVDQGRVRGGDLGTVDCIGRTIFNQEGKEGVDAVDQEDYNDTGDGEEDGEAAPHGGRDNKMSAVDEAVVMEKVRILGGMLAHKSSNGRGGWRSKTQGLRPEVAATVDC